MLNALSKLSVFYTLLTLSFSAMASLDDVAVGFGNYHQFVAKVQVKEDGSNSKFEFSPYLTTQAEWSFTDNFSFFPEFGILLDSNKRDELISKRTFYFQGSFGYAINDWVIRLGLGLSMTRISGDGGSQTLNNGSTTTSFPMPEGSATSRNVITNIGVDYFFHQEWSARLEGTVFNPINSRNRAFSSQLAVHYHFYDLFASKKKKDSPKIEKGKEDEWLK